MLVICLKALQATKLCMEMTPSFGASTLSLLVHIAHDTSIEMRHPAPQFMSYLVHYLAWAFPCHAGSPCLSVYSHFSHLLGHTLLRLSLASKHQSHLSCSLCCSHHQPASPNHCLECTSNYMVSHQRWHRRPSRLDYRDWSSLHLSEGYGQHILLILTWHQILQ